MGSQFYWFLDVIAAAVILIAVFVAAKKGFSKTVVMLVGCIVSVILAMSLCNSLTEFVYKSSIKNSNVQKIEKQLSETDMVQKTKKYIENLGYSVRINDERLTSILSEDGDTLDAVLHYLNNINGVVVDTPENFKEKMASGYADMMKSMLTEAVSPYAGEIASEKISSDIDGFMEIIRAIASHNPDDSYKAPAEMIESACTEEASKTTVKTVCFSIIAVLVILVAAATEHRLNSGTGLTPLGSIAERGIGAIFGSIEGIIILIIISVIIRMLIIFGNSGMILFNTETIDKTFLFRHIYNFAEML